MQRSINGARGEVAATLGGERTRLCLTLGALAQIETALALGDGEGLADRLSAVTARDIEAILRALLEGGGASEAEALRIAAQASPDEAARAVADAFAASVRP